MRVAVAMSGGIDSSVAAFLLKQQGLDVHGVFMHNWDARIESGRHCTAEQDFQDAARAAEIVKVPLLRVSFVREYWNDVFGRMISTYSSGSTPNPDVLCNREIKFGRLLSWALEQKFASLATGHYANIVDYGGAKFIAQASDLKKDQSYFLSDVSQRQLAHVLFPLGAYHKSGVRQIALRAGLGFLLEKPESMGVCFVGKRRRFAEFLAEFLPPAPPGDIVEEEGGLKLGEHRGAVYYTIGQSVKIGGMPSRMYVTRKCSKSGAIFASSNKCSSSMNRTSLLRSHPLLCTRQVLLRMREALPDLKNVYCSIRSADKTGQRVTACLETAPGVYRIEAEGPFWAPAPGQVLHHRLKVHL